jgi:hypothetical protein
VGDNVLLACTTGDQIRTYVEHMLSGQPGQSALDKAKRTLDELERK